MTPELSRRIAAVAGRMKFATFPELVKFLERAEVAESFDGLSPEDQELVTDAEAEAK